MGSINKDFLIFSLSSWVIFLTVELTARINDLYRIWPEIDVLTHILSGIAVTSTVIFFLDGRLKISWKKTAMISISLIIAGLWEIIETTTENIVSEPKHLRDVFFWDGFFDVFFAVIGGLFALCLILWIKRKFKVRLPDI